MMLKVLGSSSSGNCYLLQTADHKQTLVIEAGVAMAEVKRALHFDLSGVVACIVSHEHNDHAKHVGEFLQCGIRVLALESVFEAKQVRNRAFCKVIEPMHGYKVGGFKVLPVPVVHDVPCVGFIIEHAEMGRLLFITDTMMLEYRLPKLDHIMIEANYADDILQWNIDNGIVPQAMRQRLEHSHMELRTTKEILRVNDIADVNNIVLIHLSASNSDSRRFKREIEQCTGKPTFIADKGVGIELNKEPY